jgi:hypothetical protein
MSRADRQMGAEGVTKTLIESALDEEVSEHPRRRPSTALSCGSATRHAPASSRRSRISDRTWPRAVPHRPPVRDVLEATPVRHQSPKAGHPCEKARGPSKARSPIAESAPSHASSVATTALVPRRGVGTGSRSRPSRRRQRCSLRPLRGNHTGECCCDFVVPWQDGATAQLPRQGSLRRGGA